jgi:hypothetical protein
VCRLLRQEGILCPVPRIAHKLEIVITAWKDLVELCTVENSIAVAGLKQFLASLDDLYQILEEMFKVVPNFGLLLWPSAQPKQNWLLQPTPVKPLFTSALSSMN